MEKQYMTAAEVADALGVSLGKAYAVIRDLNSELQSKGYLTVSGKISRAYFNEKWYAGKEVV